MLALRFGRILWVESSTLADCCRAGDGLGGGGRTKPELSGGIYGAALDVRARDCGALIDGTTDASSTEAFGLCAIDGVIDRSEGV